MSKGKRLVPVSVVAIALMGVGAVALYWAQMIRQQRWDATNTELLLFSACARSHMLLNSGAVPGTRLDEAFRAITRDSHAASRLSSCRLLQSGSDAWSHQFVYESADGGRRITIRSVGPNGQDEGGGGDDIQQVIELD